MVLADVEKAALDAAVAELRGAAAPRSRASSPTSRSASLGAGARRRGLRRATAPSTCSATTRASAPTRRRRLWDAPDNDWSWAFRVNVWGVIHGIKAFVPRMLAARRGGPRGEHLVGQRRPLPAALHADLRDHQGGGHDALRGAPPPAPHGGREAPRGGALPGAPHREHRHLPRRAQPPRGPAARARAAAAADARRRPRA